MPLRVYQVSFLHPTEAFHGDLGMLKPIDIVMLISYSGETDDVNKLIPSLKNFGNKIIAVTSNKIPRSHAMQIMF